MSFFKDESRTAITKRLLILLAIIMLVFAIINAVWYFGYQQRYNAIAKIWKLHISTEIMTTICCDIQKRSGIIRFP